MPTTALMEEVLCGSDEVSVEPYRMLSREQLQQHMHHGAVAKQGTDRSRGRFADTELDDIAQGAETRDSPSTIVSGMLQLTVADCKKAVAIHHGPGLEDEETQARTRPPTFLSAVTDGARAEYYGREIRKELQAEPVPLTNDVTGAVMHELVTLADHLSWMRAAGRGG